MADDADMSDDRIEGAVTSGVAEARYKLAQRQLIAIGYCHYCEQELPQGRLFCNNICANDWQHEQDRLRALGRK